MTESRTTTYRAKGGLWQRRDMPTQGGEDPPPTTYLLNVTFDDWTTTSKGGIGVTYWNTRMGGGGGTANLEDSSVVAVSGEGNVLRTYLEANTIRSNPAGNNGSSMVCTLPQQVEEVYLEFRFRFTGASWPWAKGGKLPGLAGVAPGESLSWPAGGHGPHLTTGWSNRTMWLTSGAGWSWIIGSRPNIGLDYDYGYDQVEQYGDNRFWPTATSTSPSFLSDTWHVVKKRIRMNTVGSANGVLQTWLDGTLVNDVSNREYRTRSDVKIGLVYWDVFRGGASLDWAAGTDSNIDISYIKVWVP